ncbi:hypothetical protein ABEB36_013518 [Hypothenemus hampei]|uniref:Uncharacterized protein n=1 Tax=Hypothenemus hampei TaxID=57062 RepID=A0ABD1E5E1_HYPHA
MVLNDERDHKAVSMVLKVPVTTYEKGSAYQRYSELLTPYAFQFIQKQIDTLDKTSKSNYETKGLCNERWTRNNYCSNQRLFVTDSTIHQDSENPIISRTIVKELVVLNNPDNISDKKDANTKQNTDFMMCNDVMVFDINNIPIIESNAPDLDVAANCKIDTIEVPWVSENDKRVCNDNSLCTSASGNGCNFQCNHIDTNIKMPPKIKKRGRPKGRNTIIIGLSKKKRTLPNKDDKEN